MIQNVRKSLGFSLVEVLVSLGILSLAALVLASVLISTRRAQQAITDSAAARSLAEQTLERTQKSLRLENSLEVERFWSDDHDASTPWREGQHKVGSTEYFYRVEAVTVLYSPSGDKVGTLNGSAVNTLKHLKVVVTWKPPNTESGPQRGRQTVSIAQLWNREKN